MPKLRSVTRAAACLATCLVASVGHGALAGAAGQRPWHGHAAATEGKPRLSTHSPRNRATVSGRIKWRVVFRGPRPRRIDLAIDGAVRIRLVGRRGGAGRLTGRSGTATLDTRRLANGRHTLTAIAHGPAGRRFGSRVKVTVENPVGPALPEGGSQGPSAPPSTPPNGSSIFWGAWIGSHLTGSEAPWDMGAVDRFESIAQKKVSIVHFGSPFANCATAPCSYYSFPWTPFGDIRAHGSIPMLSWSSQSLPSSLDQPDFQLSDVISGAYDAYIRSFAEKAREWGHPFFLRFNWEMNGDWFSWSEGVNGNLPGEYVAAWRRVHDIFTAVGATNASWVWCPNIDPSGSLQELGPLYPGDSYVDWTCLDGYNWGTNRAGIDPTSPLAWRSFDQLYGSTYRRIVERIAPAKPMLVGEVSSSEHGGSKAAWVEDALATLPSYRKIRGLVWFERFDSNMDWPIGTSAAAASAFASGIQRDPYTANSFGSISSSPILPPG